MTLHAASSIFGDKMRSSRPKWQQVLAQGLGDDVKRATLSHAEVAAACQGLSPSDDEDAGGAGGKARGARPALRAFLSSTFTDTKAERDMLAADVYPFLKQYGRTLGVEFMEPSEMRWGIRASASDEHQTSTICIAEIERCKLESSGFTYVLIASDKVRRSCP
jgi:hypothetical protein